MFLEFLTQLALLKPDGAARLMGLPGGQRLSWMRLGLMSQPATPQHLGKNTSKAQHLNGLVLYVFFRVPSLEPLV